ncbi:hypothetical protein B566_EDAN001270 [Ephemera danica]|nr:hypothetical protein B566_EDAN001270 [Ephemera danica]
MEEYKVLGRIGEGAHGLVLRAKHKSTGNEVALKKLLLKRMDDGVPIQIVREIKALQEVDCPYGESDIDQLCVVLRMLGSPNTKDWPGLTKLPDYNKITFPHTPGIPFEQIIPDAHPQALDLVRNFLAYNPDKRIQAKEALIHPYFFTSPLPLPLVDMPKPLDDHRQQFKMQEYYIEQPASSLLNGLRNLNI